MSLLSQLTQYEPFNEVDRIHKQEFIAFVENNPNCFARDNVPGHVTGSAWLLDPSGTKVLLTRHKKLGKWLQLGGHADGEKNILNVALREAREESGLSDIHPITPEIFDIDIHLIPPYGQDPEHYHYDVRFLLQSGDTTFAISNESHELAWVELEKISEFSSEESLLRMARKFIDFHRKNRN